MRWVRGEACRGAVPYKSGCCRRNAGARETRLFWNLARHVRDADHRGDVGRDDLLVLLPSFLITELTEAFQIGF
ncbi:MAG: EscR/YscR/HrcR family type III secretion system export apparatus protein, partial [Deltaproteobacteria bacterium]|nr:EscR/YscR/HrcR family type III secretion system export apparatus protein [Deltaproteobacteria bacterium]